MAADAPHAENPPPAPTPAPAPAPSPDPRAGAGAAPVAAAESRSPQMLVFVASAVGLFLELALIRWVSCEIRIFAYFKNMVLVACFLGFGIGCFRHRRPARFGWAIGLLLLLCLVVQAPGKLLGDYGPRSVSGVLAGMPGLMIFYGVDTVVSWSQTLQLAFALAWTVALFCACAFLLVPFGQCVGAAMERIPGRLQAYSVNVAGSLAGIVAYTLATSAALPPICWFAPAAAACALLAPTSARAILAATLGILAILLPANTEANYEIWSPYQKLAVTDGWVIGVNNIGYQVMGVQRRTPAGEAVPRDRFTLPYAVRRPPGHVLIVGAGSGNDVSAALCAGATSVVACDIDPVIVKIGRAVHPDQPYSDPRVEVVVDDARHYLKTATRSFDVIVFSHLDSHTVLSSYTNVRLDDYLYTVESLRDARRRLAPEGFIYLSFFAEQPYVAERLGKNLALAFGHEPIALFSDSPARNLTVTSAHFVIGEPDLMPRLTAATADWNEFRHVDLRATRVLPSTDAWPFLPLEKPQVPVLVWLLSGIVLGMSAVFGVRARPAGERFDGRLFWMGAAFMLVEVHNVSRLALQFGTTWQVNAWVIGAILGAILLANVACAGLRARGWGNARWIRVGLFASLAAVYFAPLDRFLELPGGLGGGLATLLLTTPIFFAGLVFADAFASSPAPGFALGWNVLGALFGGMTESVSYVLGIPGLVPVAAGFYGLALIWPRRGAAGAGA
ncbi:MAG: methyltransferase domain-containing protein [Planctomycetes bacterium]|nr:methyltransferase domain-containing protein [Planctomycetota bacterium]